MSNYAPYMPTESLNRRNVEHFDDFASVNTPELKRIGGDWLRINGGGNGQTALYGNLSVNDGGEAGGLTVGDWKAAGQGNIVATGMINTPSIRRVGGDWLRINDGGNGKAALYGNLSVNDGGEAGGLTVGNWGPAGQGNIVATGMINTPELKRIGGDWLRINGGGNGQTALYGNLSVNDGGAAGGLTVGNWGPAGQGKIIATEGITVKGRDLLAELDAIKAKIGM